MTKEQQELTLNNLKLVHYLIKKHIHINPGHPEYEDYYQEGCVGLIEASMRFDPTKGFKFATFGSSYIFGYLLRYKYYKLPLIKYPRSRIDNKKKVALYMVDNPEATPDDIMRDLNLSYQKYTEAIHTVEYYEDFAHLDDDGKSINPLDMIADPNELSIESGLELSSIYDDIDEILDKIRFVNPKAKQIFIEYIYDVIYIENRSDRTSQTEYANKYGYSQPQVARVIRHGMELLRNELRKRSY